MPAQSLSDIPGNFQDLTGQRFNRLTAISISNIKEYPSGTKTAMWNCRCECGKDAVVSSVYLRTGHTKSCGCLQIEVRRKLATTHGHYINHKPTRILTIYKGMCQRCSDPNSPSWPYYGAKGIMVMWNTFEEFLADMGPSYKPGLTIGRKQNDQHYCKENCEWQTYAEQNRNYSRNVNFTIDGITKCKSDWADHFGIERSALDVRLKLGWSIEEALTIPIGQRRTRA